ncbi:protein of unknown function [Hyphomicrobium sp. 1Nfss2.1]|uniref:hypothetical protein n=1 Tax=Hyphomicrobium sp. 1Nfss2.1 TaxID=3413936 RepID=UPI003C7CBE2B
MSAYNRSSRADSSVASASSTDRARLRVPNSTCIALALVAVFAPQSPAVAACDTAGIDGYPAEPVAHCAEAEITAEGGSMAGCDGNLEEMATTGANAYAAKGNLAAADYAGPIGGFFDTAAERENPTNACVVSCLKLPLGSKIVETRAATTTAASQTTPMRRVYAVPRKSMLPGNAAYISKIIVVESTIGPVVCMAVANWQNRPADQGFRFYAYYEALAE